MWIDYFGGWYDIYELNGIDKTRKSCFELEGFKVDSGLWGLRTSSMNHIEVYWSETTLKLLGDSGEVPSSKWSGWRFDSHCEIFSLLDEKILAK